MRSSLTREHSDSDAPIHLQSKQKSDDLFSQSRSKKDERLFKMFEIQYNVRYKINPRYHFFLLLNFLNSVRRKINYQIIEGLASCRCSEDRSCRSIELFADGRHLQRDGMVLDAIPNEIDVSMTALFVSK